MLKPYLNFLEGLVLSQDTVGLQGLSHLPRASRGKPADQHTHTHTYTYLCICSCNPLDPTFSYSCINFTSAICCTLQNTQALRIHTYIYIYIYTYTHTHIYTHTHTHTYIYIYIYLRTSNFRQRSSFVTTQFSHVVIWRLAFPCTIRSGLQEACAFFLFVGKRFSSYFQPGALLWLQLFALGFLDDSCFNEYLTGIRVGQILFIPPESKAYGWSKLDIPKLAKLPRSYDLMIY